MHLKNIKDEKNYLFAYLRFCVFYAGEEKKMVKEKSPHNVGVLKIPMLPQLG